MIDSLFYLTYHTDNADQAISLTDYLQKHGICASRDGVEMVTCPMDDPATAAVVYDLRKNWAFYWDHWDATLMGLPVFEKP